MCLKNSGSPFDHKLFIFSDSIQESILESSTGNPSCIYEGQLSSSHDHKDNFSCS